MSDVAGLVLLCFLSMIAPVALILYIKWDDIKASSDRRKNKSKEEDFEYKEPSKLKAWWNTYFGKAEPVVENVDVHVSEKIVEKETKTTQQLLEEQRKIEKKEKAIAKAKAEAEEKAKKKAEEKEKIKSSKNKSKSNKNKK